MNWRCYNEHMVDGVIEMVLQACHTYNVKSMGIRRFVNDKKHIPYIIVETDYSQADIGQLNTRIAAFLSSRCHYMRIGWNLGKE